MLTHERRLLASVIDIGIMLTVTLLVGLFIPKTIFTRDLTYSLIYFVVAFIYEFVSLFVTKDRTIGLYAMSLRLLGRDWDKPNIKSILIRSITHAVPILYIVNILYMLLNKTQDTFFDELSNSIIVQTGDSYIVDNKDKEQQG